MILIHNRAYDRPRLMKALAIDMPMTTTFDAMDCLSGKTRIPTWDGDTLYLSSIVEQKLTPTLIGLNDQGERIPVNIIGHHSRVVQNQAWIAFNTVGTRFRVKVTPEHQIWTRRGWVEAKDVVVGDEVISSRIGSDDLIHGTLLGDGSMRQGKLACHRRTFSMEHGNAQFDYIQAKARHLGIKRLVPAKCKPSHIAVGTISELWNDRCYIKGWKQWDAPTDRALAVWYMDDGHHRCSSNRDALGGAIIALGKYAHQGHEVATWFKAEFGPLVSFDQARNGEKLTARIYIRREAVRNFFTRIAPFVHPSMDYKLPLEFRGRYDGWLEQDVPVWVPVTQITTTRNRTSVRYCVSVDHPTARFFTQTALVHNCWHVCFNSLPKKLGFVTACLPSSKGIRLWKNLSQLEPAYYSAMDSISLLRNWFDTQDILKATGALSVYDLICRDLDPTLEHMSQRGLLVDQEAKDALEVELIATLTALTQQMDALVPDDVKSPHIWKSEAGAIKGKATLVDRLRREGDSNWELVAAAPLYAIGAKKKVTQCSACAKVGVTKPHVTRKTLKQEAKTVPIDQPVTKPATTVVIMRRPCVQEDEGRHFYVKGPLTEAEAKAWIAAQKGEYFSPGDYYTVTQQEQEPAHGTV